MMPQEENERVQSKRSSGNRPKSSKSEKSASGIDLKDDKIRTTSRRPRAAKESPVPSSVPRYNPSIRDAKRPDVPPPPVGYMVFDEEEDDGLDNLWDFDSEDMQQTVADRPSRSRGKSRDTRGRDRDADKGRRKLRDDGRAGKDAPKSAVKEGGKDGDKESGKDSGVKDANRGRTRGTKAEPAPADADKSVKPVRGRKPGRDTADYTGSIQAAQDSSLKDDDSVVSCTDRNRQTVAEEMNVPEVAPLDNDRVFRKDRNRRERTGRERNVGKSLDDSQTRDDSRTRTDSSAESDAGKLQSPNRRRGASRSTVDQTAPQTAEPLTETRSEEKSALDAPLRIATRKESTRKTPQASAPVAASAPAIVPTAVVAASVSETTTAAASTSLREEIKRKLKEELLEELRLELQEELRAELGLKSPLSARSAAPVQASPSESQQDESAVQTFTPKTSVVSPEKQSERPAGFSRTNNSADSNAGSENLAEKKTPDFQKEQENPVKNSAGKSNRKTDRTLESEGNRDQTQDRVQNRLPADEESDWRLELPPALLKEIDFGPDPNKNIEIESDLSWERSRTKRSGKRAKSAPSSDVADSPAASTSDRVLGNNPDSENVPADTDSRKSKVEPKDFKVKAELQDNRRDSGNEPSKNKDSSFESNTDSSSKTDDNPKRGGESETTGRIDKSKKSDKPKKFDKPEKSDKPDASKGSVDPSAWANNEFNQFHLRPEIMRALQEFDYLAPTPIQTGVIPVVADGKDVMGQAQTGTGKTAAFGLPLLQAIEFNELIFSPRALILVPTRELAVQVRDEIQKMGKYCDISICAFYGGAPLIKQTRQLSDGVDIAVGTPGRVIDLMNRRALDLSQLKYVVLDEADRMLDIGFRPDIEKILRRCPDSRQTLLLSATIPPQVDSLARHYMKSPEKLDFSPKNLSVDTIDQYYFSVEPHNKTELLERLLQRENPHQAIIFCRTKRRTELLTNIVKKWYPDAEGMHGDLDQGKRMHVMSRFREGKVRILVATDVVGRGIDVSGISHIINYDIPQFCDDYVHRVGRTGRMGHEGVAYTFVTAEEGIELTRIEMRINRLLKRDEIPGFVAFTLPVPSVIPPEDDKFKTNETPVEDSPAKPVFGKRVRKVRRAL